MVNKPVTIHAKNLFGSFSEPSEYLNCENGYINSFQWPNDIGSGSMSMIKLQPGLMLGVANYKLKKNIEVEFEHHTSSIVLSFSTSGHLPPMVSRLQDNLCGGCPYNESGYEVLSYIKGGQGVIRPLKDTRINYVNIALDPKLAHSVFSNRDQLFPADIMDKISGLDGKQFSRISPLRPAVSLIVRQIMNCPYVASLKRLYYECKALELIILCLGHFAEMQAGNSSFLHPMDMDRVHYARELVERDYQNPPRLLDLAKQVGMPHPKLNSCFRRVYGTTIFDYLREYRLQKARTLLDGGSMNVTEVAYEVGYSSLSHFTKAFKEHVGMAPKEYRKNVY